MACMGKGRGPCRLLVEKPEEEGPLGRPRHRWEDNIKMYLKEVQLGAWTRLTWLRIGKSGRLL